MTKLRYPAQNTHNFCWLVHLPVFMAANKKYRTEGCQQRKPETTKSGRAPPSKGMATAAMVFMKDQEGLVC